MPCAMRRTVKFVLEPALRRLITTPSNACRRSLSPSTTFAVTRTVSPIWNSATFAFGLNSTTLLRSIVSAPITRAEASGRPDLCHSERRPERRRRGSCRMVLTNHKIRVAFAPASAQNDRALVLPVASCFFAFVCLLIQLCFEPSALGVGDRRPSQQVRSATRGAQQLLPPPPARDLGVMAAQQNIRNARAAEVAGPRVLWVLKQSGAVRFLYERFVRADHPRHQ